MSFVSRCGASHGRQCALLPTTIRWSYHRVLLSHTGTPSPYSLTDRLHVCTLPRVVQALVLVLFKHYSFSSLSLACILSFFHFLWVFSVITGYELGSDHDNERELMAYENDRYQDSNRQ